jgi:hypothetical protein
MLVNLPDLLENHTHSFIKGTNRYCFLLAGLPAISRHHRLDKRVTIPSNLPPVLERLSINRRQWLRQSQQFESLYASPFA